MKLTNTQINLAEQLLLSIVNRENVVEYNELATRINPTIFWRQVGKEIGEVSKLCHELGLPLLSAKVISKGQGKVGIGFYNLMKELGIDTKGKSEKELFSQELKKIRECKEWYKLADYLMLNLDLPRPSEINNNISNQLKPIKEYSAPSKELIIIQKTSWIIPSNVEAYDVIGAFRKLPEIDWRQSVNYQIGDIVYIYCTKPYQRIIFMTEVQAININFEDTIDDREFWKDQSIFKGAKDRRYVRLKIVKGTETDLLTLSKLLENGLKTAPQGPLRALNQLETFICLAFQQSIPLDRNDSELPEEIITSNEIAYTEGAKRQIIVNAYERNPIARNKCILIHGSKCVICGFDFSNFYGTDFQGKIHIHHIKPLHLIDDTYEVNPEHDLVPVCPNCHMVLHSKKDGVYSIEDVQQMIIKNRRYI